MFVFREISRLISFGHYILRCWILFGLLFTVSVASGCLSLYRRSLIESVSECAQDGHVFSHQDNYHEMKIFPALDKFSKHHQDGQKTSQKTHARKESRSLKRPQNTEIIRHKNRKNNSRPILLSPSPTRPRCPKNHGTKYRK